MRKEFLCKTLVLGVVVLFFCISFTGSTYSLSMSRSQMFNFDGNTLYVGGSGEGNYSKIQDAIDNASDGDTVFVYDDSSPYYEWEILIDKSINLIGEDRDTTVIDGNNCEDWILYVTKDRVNISGFSIINGRLGIMTYECDNIIISDNHFINCLGIYLWFSDDICIISNTFKKNWWFIMCDCVDDITISDNILIASGQGGIDVGTIHSWGGTNYVITNNTFISDDNGGDRTCINLGRADNSIIQGNEFNDNGLCAIYLGKGKNNIISHNNITNSEYGIYLGPYQYWIFVIFLSNNIISYNNITNNDYGIYIKPFSHSNKIINNNFINNRQDAKSYFLTFNNKWDGNYWDKWIGVRYPFPIFQKFPKIIVSRADYYGKIPWINIDWHPAKEPYDI